MDILSIYNIFHANAYSVSVTVQMEARILFLQMVRVHVNALVKITKSQ